MAEKTEAPTPRRKQQAREKGQGVGRSWEFSMGLTLGVGVLGLASLLPGAARTLSDEMRGSILHMNPHLSNQELVAIFGGAITTSIAMILPLALLVLAAGIAGALVSGGLVFAPKAIVFDLGKINPLTGLRRLVDRGAAVRLGLSTAKLAILATITWQVVMGKIPQILSTQGASIATITGVCLDALFQLGLTITILLAVVALVDFVVQRRRAMESLKMTKQEVIEEYKSEEGDPQIRGARRRKARQLAFARMMDAVPTADVVVTNPTHLAVALKYDSLTMKAPKIVAKGQRLVAERIKEIARKNRVPIVEDKPLARALFTRPIGAEVPAHLYRAVARLLVLVHQTRFGMARGGQHARRGWAQQPRWATAVAGAAASMPWWAEAAASVGRTIDDEEVAARHGRIVEGPSAGDSAGGGADGDYSAGPAGDTIHVDEAALARALADDELGGVTAQELAELDAMEPEPGEPEPDEPEPDEQIEPHEADSEMVDKPAGELAAEPEHPEDER